MGAKPFSSYCFQDKHFQPASDRKRAGFAAIRRALVGAQPAFSQELGEASRCLGAAALSEAVAGRGPCCRRS